MCGRCDDLGGEVRGHLATLQEFSPSKLRLVGTHPSQMSHLAGPMMLFSDSHHGPAHAWILGVSDSWSTCAGRTI